MSTTCIPAVSAPVEITPAARTAGLGPGFRVVMAHDAHHRAITHAHTAEEGVAAITTALCASLTALLEAGRPLPPGTSWTFHTGEILPLRWAVLVAADEADPRAVVLYLTPPF